MDRGKLKCSHCQTTGRNVTNDYCKNKTGEGKKDSKQEVAKTVASKQGRTPAGTPPVSDSEGEEDHKGQAVYHNGQHVNHGSKTPYVNCTISTTLSHYRKGFTKLSLPDTGATIYILGHQIAKKMILKVHESKVKLTNASGDYMSMEGETQLFLSAPGGAVRRVRAVVKNQLGRNFSSDGKTKTGWVYYMKTGPSSRMQ